MIDLSQPTRLVEGVPLVQDDRRPLTWHVPPAPPSVARGDDGRPKVSLLRRIEDGVCTGGWFELEVEAGWPAEQLEAARAALMEELDEDEVTLTPLSVRGAEAEIFFATAAPAEETLEAALETPPEEGGPTFFRTVTVAQPLLSSPHRARLSARLTPTGVDLFEGALRSGAARVGAVLRLQVEGLRPARAVRATVDWGRVYDHVSTHYRSGAMFHITDARTLVETLREQRIVEIVAVEGPATGDAEGESQDVGAVIDWVQDSLVARFLKPVLPLSREPATASLGSVGEAIGVGSDYVVKAITQIERAVATFDFQQPRVGQRTLVAQAHLADLLGGADPDEHIADASLDHPFFARMAFELRAARPLAELGVAEVVCDWRWGNEVAALRLVPGEEVAGADAFTDQSPDGTWTVDLQITLAEDAPAGAGETVRIDPITGDSRSLTLDLEALLGLRRLDVLPPHMEGLLTLRLAVSHRRDGAVLSSQTEQVTGRARFAFLDVRPEDRLLVEPTFFLAPMRIVPGAPVDADAAVLPLPPPATWRTVEVWSAGDFGGMSQLVATLQSPGGDVVLSFDAGDQKRAARLDFGDSDERAYRVRVVKAWPEGRVEEDPWIDTDLPVLQVGPWPADRLVVSIRPLGPELPQAGLRLVEIAFEYLDPANRVRHEDTVLIHSVSEAPQWTAEIVDPARRAYRFRVTLHRLDGTADIRPWAESEARLLPIPLIG